MCDCPSQGPSSARIPWNFLLRFMSTLSVSALVLIASVLLGGIYFYVSLLKSERPPALPVCHPQYNSGGLAVQGTRASHNFFLLIHVAHLSFYPIRQTKHNLDLISSVILLSFVCVLNNNREKKPWYLWAASDLSGNPSRCGWENRGDAIQMLELPSARNADVHSPRVSRWWPLWHCSCVPHAGLPSLHVHALISRSAWVYSWDAAFLHFICGNSY